MNISRKNHLALKVPNIPQTVLLSGDPQRIREMASIWDEYEEIGDNREYFTVIGRYKGCPVAACSTGIGGPSTEIALIELYQHGARNFIRVGTSGGLAPAVHAGDLVLSSACIRETGAADAYVPRSFPATGSHEILFALIEACSECGRNFHVGLGVTVDSFYATKTHLISEKGFPSTLEPQIGDWVDSGALHVEMETATVFVLASLLGARAGSICTAGSNLPRGERPPAPPPNLPAIQVACRSVTILERWDKLAAASECRFSPRLLADNPKITEVEKAE
jgi:uridine phosphorylase